MDRTVPAGAAILLGFIYETETSRRPPECYETIYGHNEGKLAKALTQMTIGEVQSAQRSWSRRFGSSATGAPQLMRATLKGLIDELGLSTQQKLDADLQDRLGYHLLIRRGYHQFMTGEIGRAEFGRRLAQEWASFPVLVATKGAKRNLTRGQSYYAGDGLNKALVTPEKVEAVLDMAMRAGSMVIAPETVKRVVEDADKTGARSTTEVVTTVTGIGGVATAIKQTVDALRESANSLVDAGPWILLAIVIAGGAIYVIRERRRKAGLARAAKEAMA